MNKIYNVSISLGALAATSAVFSKFKQTVVAESTDHESVSSATPSHLILKQVQVYFRHGARTPIHIIPALGEVSYYDGMILRDVPHTLFNYKIITFGTGNGRPFAPLQEAYDKKKLLKGGGVPGTLTRRGQDQMYELGLSLRRDYGSLIGEEFLQDEVFFRSTNINRTIDSLRCVLAGIYGSKELNAKGPINIPVGDDLKEILFPNSHNCHVVRQLIHAAMIYFDDIPNIEEDRNVIEKLLGIEASKGYRKLNFIHLRDDLAAREAHGYNIPSIIKPYIDMIERDALKLMVCAFAGQTGAERTLALRLGVGQTIGCTLDEMDAMVKGKSKQKLCLYSTHDSTLVALLNSLDCFDDVWPPFAADLRFELFVDNHSQYWVKVLYCGKEVKVRGCSTTLVPYEEFVKNIRPMSIEEKEYHQICKSNILEKIAKDLVAHEKDEVESEEDKEDSDKPAGM